MCRLKLDLAENLDAIREELADVGVQRFALFDKVLIRPRLVSLGRVFISKQLFPIFLFILFARDSDSDLARNVSDSVAPDEAIESGIDTYVLYNKKWKFRMSRKFDITDLT